MEVWKDIPGYEGYYQASTLGNIRSVSRKTRSGYHTGKVLKQRTNHLGYKKVFLCKEGKQKLFSVHRLVALTFIPNPCNLPQVNHKDEVKANNNVFNLEWCTAAYNITYGTRVQRQAEKLRGVPRPERRGKTWGISFKSRGENPHARKVAQMDLEGNIIQIHNCILDAGEAVGSNRHTIASACKRAYVSKGYRWAYLDEVQEKVNSGTY